MSLTFNSSNIISLELSYPRKGAWNAVAYFWEDDYPVIGDKGTLTIDDIELVGVIKSIGITSEYIKCQIVGGKKGTLTDNPKAAKHLFEPSGKQIIDAILNQSDETLGNIPFDILTYKAKQWQVTKDASRGKQLSRFIERFTTYTWRIDQFGFIEIIDDVSTKSTFKIPEDDFILTSTRDDGSPIYSVTRLTSMPFPGSFVDDVMIEETLIKANADEVVITLLYKSFTELFDTISNRSHKEVFQSSYEAVVESQNSDGTLNVIPKDRKIKGGGLKNVPIRFGTANLTVSDIPVGTLCTIQFDSSNPEKIWCSGFQAPSTYLLGAINTFGDPNSAQFVALANKVNARFAAIENFINNSLVLTAPTGPTAPGAVTPLIPEEDVDCTKLKTE